MSKHCVCCGREIPDSEYNFTCDFCKFEQMRIEEDFRKRLREAYDEGKAAGYKLAAKEVLSQVKDIIDDADHVVSNDSYYDGEYYVYDYDYEVGYDKNQVDAGLDELCKRFKVQL